MKKRPPKGPSPSKARGTDTEIAEISRHQEAHISISRWEGPVLPPEILKGYNDVVQNGAERLIRQWELEGEERRAALKRQQRFALTDHLVRRFSALIFSLCALAVAAFALSLGHQWAAVGIGGATIGMVVASFIRHSKP